MTRETFSNAHQTNQKRPHFTLNQKKRTRFQAEILFLLVLRGLSRKVFVMRGSATTWHELGRRKASPASTRKSMLDGVQVILTLSVSQNSPIAFKITGKEPLGQLDKST